MLPLEVHFSLVLSSADRNVQPPKKPKLNWNRDIELSFLNEGQKHNLEKWRLETDIMFNLCKIMSYVKIPEKSREIIFCSHQEQTGEAFMSSGVKGVVEGV